MYMYWVSREFFPLLPFLPLRIGAATFQIVQPLLTRNRVKSSQSEVERKQVGKRGGRNLLSRAPGGRKKLILRVPKAADR